MATEIYMRRTAMGFVPTDGQSEDELHKITIGDEVKVTVKKYRNAGHHRKFFALIKLVLDNQERYQSTVELLDMIKIAVGHVNVRVSPSGQEYKVPASINWASMDQAEFNDFYKRVVDVVCKYFIPGLDEGALKQELMEFTT